jgi:hypothetical protein
MKDRNFLKASTFSILLFASITIFGQESTPTLNANGRSVKTGPNMNNGQSLNVNDPKSEAAFQAHQAKIDQALRAKDYDAWKNEHDAWGGKNPNAEKVTRENFGTFVAMRDAQKAGNFARAQELRTELGFTQGNGNDQCKKLGQGKGKGKGKGMGSSQGKGRGKKGGMGNCLKQ